MWSVQQQVLTIAAVLIAQCGYFSAADDLCQRCECLPTQAICRANLSAPKEFYPATSETNRDTLELVYIYGIETVIFDEDSFLTKKPVTILIQNCTNVNISDRAVGQLQTLAIRDTVRVHLGVLNRNVLWATLLENIDELTIDSSSLSANYSVSIEHVRSLSIQQSSTPSEAMCEDSTENTFSMYDCKVNPIDRGAMSLCGGHVTLESNTFESIDEEGFQITTEGSVAIIYNTFKRLKKQSFNLTAPEIHITGNHFQHLPAGSLRGVSTMLDTFFTNNTIKDIDLGGVLLDLGWDMIIENNIMECDCASKRTSILNPKEDMLYLTNTSLDKLHTTFLNNFCLLNCTVSLETFSNALSQGLVCITNNTRLEQELLCGFTVEAESATHPTSINSFVFSSASRLEFLIPLSIIVVAILITISVCYGCREMRTFKFKFNPSSGVQSKDLL